MNKLTVSTSPHIHSKASTQKIMRDVLIALSPATVAALVYYGWNAAIIISVCLVGCVLTEFLFNLCVKKPQTVGDLSAAVTGLILALSLPVPSTDNIYTGNVWNMIWPCLVGSVFAILVVKCLFGGLGCNFANPAVTARVLMLVAFSGVYGTATKTLLAKFADAPHLIASATPLASIKASGALPFESLTDMLFGNRGGAIGEGCVIALLLGFIYLLVRRVISWRTPVAFVGTVAVFSFIYYYATGADLTLVLYQIMGGGLLFGAIFMATDYVTTPINKWGKVVFAVGCGIITCLIRFWGNYPEGVSFAILFMNILSPYIEKWCAKKPLGGVKNAK